AGFLISSYKHILKNNHDEKGYTTLTPDDKGRMAGNFSGYDISPDMVRLSLVNMYLHGFSDPHIFEYDTLTSQERWNEYADVILANPPFMSPKGGIRPHNRFSVQSKRSEVLFVDYIADHLTPEGRAGVIVPEGIIFQSQNAYKQLRKKLLEESLVAVISLPAGVFQPYSGVKTSILILDKALAKKADTIGFFKVENDGFGLGAQRRPIDKNDLPRVLEELIVYVDQVKTGDCSDEYTPAKGLIVKREKVAQNGEYNLSGERYRTIKVTETRYPKVPIREILNLRFGERITKREKEGSLYPVYGGGGESFKTDSYNCENDVVISRFAMSPKCVRVVNGKFFLLDSGFTFSVSEAYVGKLLKPYVINILLSIQDLIYNCARGHAQKNIDIEAFRDISIPLPSLEIQKEIVAEIESYQKVIDGARAVVENYRPHIPIDPNWPIYKLGEVCDVRDGTHDSPKYIHDKGYPLVTSKNLKDGLIDFTDVNLISREDLDKINNRSFVDDGDIIMPMIGTIGKPVIVNKDREFAIKNVALIKFNKESRVLNRFLRNILSSDAIDAYFKNQSAGSTQKFISLAFIRNLSIPIPPIKIQEIIIGNIEVEQAIVNSNRNLIKLFEDKIEKTINRVWGDE
ncbi:MAG: restriction endonuclease subunit M/S, partial [Candidatus Omnitrophica bacterium]|nr:restriction endonuclease subunit M/S [Candidatus Omnitrophota bacterium]